MGTLEILNVSAGDVKISFDTQDAAEAIRARRIVQDMLRRGYCLLIEVDGKIQRVKEFDEARGEYIIADFDSLEAAKVDAEQELPDSVVDELSRPDALPRLAGVTEDNKLCECGKPARHRGACKGQSQSRSRRTRRIPMSQTRATGVAPSAGG